MLKQEFSATTRLNKRVHLQTDLVVAGGGLAGLCAAICAAREGSKVILVQDRPVLGGNASSEIRVWALGATSHMGNNNRWSREGGVIDEIMLENQRVNKDGNPLIFDALLLDKVIAEENITLLLNTAAYQVNKSSDRIIKSIVAFCSQNSTEYEIAAPLFCDATGDGLIGFNAGASFRIGAESRKEFDELLAAEEESNQLLGHTLFFYSKKLDRPVEYTAPKFAYTQEEIGSIPRSMNIQGSDSGIKFWWIEYGGVRDTIYETEEIKWELWKIVYGIWDYIKNSGKFEDVDDLTLEWVGTVPGKRESRRFNGEYMLRQQDIVEQTQFEDAVSFGGWAIDIHPSEGIYSDKAPCSQYHSKGVYQIPYRCFVSKDIDNLFLAGRNISATHMAYGSTRVMITCAHGGQAVGTAAALCREKQVTPKALIESSNMAELQQRLNVFGHGIPGVPLNKSQSLVSQAQVSASSELNLSAYAQTGQYISLKQSCAQLLPFSAGAAPKVSVKVNANKSTLLVAQLRTSGKAENYTPDVIVKSLELQLTAGEQTIELDFSDSQLIEQYGFVTFMANEDVSIEISDQLITGTLSVFNKVHKAVSNNGKQEAPENSGIDEFEFWTPERRPKGQNLALAFEPALTPFSVNQVNNGHFRPCLTSNAWVADLADKSPTITLSWPKPINIKEIILYFNTDADHALETVLMEHPESVMPYCVRNYCVKSADGKMIAEVKDNYQTINKITLDDTQVTDKLTVELEHPTSYVPASLFEIEVR